MLFFHLNLHSVCQITSHNWRGFRYIYYRNIVFLVKVPSKIGHDFLTTSTTSKIKFTVGTSKYKNLYFLFLDKKLIDNKEKFSGTFLEKFEDMLKTSLKGQVKISV